MTEDVPPGRLRDNRDYRIWWWGNLSSATGNQFMVIAMPLMVLLLTGSPLQAGLVGSLSALPYIILALPVGVLVDRAPRRALMLLAGLTSLIAVGTVPIAYATFGLSVLHLYAVVFVNGCSVVVFFVAQQASLPRIVAKNLIGRATGQAETIERTAAIIGPTVAAWLFEQVWPAFPFAFYAMSFGVMAVAVMFIRADLGPTTPPKESQRTGLSAGVKSLWSNRLLRDLTFLNTAGDFLFAGITLLMVILVRDSGASTASVGLVFSSAAVGGLIGSMVASRLEEHLGLPVAVIGKHILTAAIFPLLLSGLPAWGIALLWASISFQVSIVGVIQRKHVLLKTADELMGRVQAVTVFLSFGALPLGTAFTGFVLEYGGITTTLAAYSAILVLLAIASIVSRAIRTGDVEHPETTSEERAV